MVEYEEPSIVNAPGFVGKTVFDPSTKRAVDKQVKVDERYITSEFGPLVISPGEVLEILDEKEKGELLYIKVITDNPYANIYLELDNYRNSQDGETHAELLYDQRTNNAEGQFYIETDGSNGKGFPVVWNPQTNPSTYNKGIKFRISNPLRPNKNALGFDLSLKGRAGLPTAIQPLHMAGGSFSHSGLSTAGLDLLASAIANPIGAGGGYIVDNVINQAVFDTQGAVLAEGNLYAGLAGKPVFRRAPETIHPASLRGVQSHNGVELLETEVGPVSALSQIPISVSAATGFPGTIDKPSTSTIIIGNQGTTGGADNVALTNFAAPNLDASRGGKGFLVGDRVFIRDGDTIYFPGEITEVKYTLNGAGVLTDYNTYSLVVKPGLKNGLSVRTFAQPTANDSITQCYGTVATFADTSPDMVVKKVIVRRKRKITYEG